MIIVVTGMVGVDKKSYLVRVCQSAKEKGKEVLLCNVGDQMYAEAPDIPPGNPKRSHSFQWAESISWTIRRVALVI